MGTSGMKKPLIPSDVLMTLDNSYVLSSTESRALLSSVYHEGNQLSQRHQAERKKTTMPLSQISESTAEIKRLQRKVNESIERCQWLNAVFNLTLLSINIQKKIGTIRFKERESHESSRD